MFFVLESFNLWSLILVVDATFSTIAIDIGKLVDCDSVSLVKGGSVKLSCRGSGLFWRVVFDEGKSIVVSMLSKPLGFRTNPSDMSWSFIGMKMASSLVLPAVFSFFSRNLMSLGFCSALTIGSPSITCPLYQR